MEYIKRSLSTLRKLQGKINDEPMGNNHFWDKNDIHQEILKREKNIRQIMEHIGKDYSRGLLKLAEDEICHFSLKEQKKLAIKNLERWGREELEEYLEDFIGEQNEN